MTTTATAIQQQLGLHTYEMDANHAIEIQTYLKEGFIQKPFAAPVKATMEEIEAAFVESCDCQVHSFSVSGTKIVFRSEKLVFSGSAQGGETLYLRGNFYGLEENVNQMAEWAKAQKPQPEVMPNGVYNIGISHVIQTPRGRDAINHHRLTSNFDNIRDDFYPLIDVPMMTKLYTEEEESILILTGEPGTGKTCFVKKALREIAVNMKRDISVKYVKDIDILKDDSFWASLTKITPDVLVLDDLDDELLPRSEGRNEIVNNLLSFSDGLFDVKTKVIITTNLSNTAIDDAITRPGRCFEILALPQLTVEQAKTVWMEGFEQTEESFGEVFGTEFPEGAKIAQAALMSEYKRFTKVGPDAYLKDTSISIREVIQNGGTAN